ncbi:MAG: hypothetical protein ACRC7P_06740, partial [Enterovibrio sp.]
WEESIEVTPADIDRQRENWTRRRDKRPIFNKKKQSLIEAALDNPDMFLDRNIYFAIYSCGGSKEALEAFEQIDNNQKLDFFENWKELPDDAYLMSIYLGPRGGIRFEGVQYMPNVPTIKKIIQDGMESNIKICTVVNDNHVGEFSFTQADQATVKEFMSHITEKKPEENDDAYIVSLHEWAKSVKKTLEKDS